jgi:hypothetical protein
MITAVREKAMANTSKRPKRTSKRVALSILVLAILIIAGTFLYAGWLGYQETPKRIEVDDPGSPNAAYYSLSEEQNSSVLSHGYPEAFTILFYEEEAPNGGIQNVRLEIWDYYSLGFGLTFINGELVAEDAIEWNNQANVVPAPYYPEQFSMFMELADVITAAGLRTYIEIPLDQELMESGKLYYAESLSFGLQENQLVYLEALALTEE